MIHPYLANRILENKEVVAKLFGSDNPDPQDLADFRELWHVASYHAWAAQSIPGKQGNVHFVWLDVPEEPIVLLERDNQFIVL